MTSTPNKGDVYDIVTSRIITQLSNGIVPWKITWTGNGLPQNALSRKQYRGINTWLLLGHGFKENLFLSEAQVILLGASVKSSETGFPVVYWKILEGDEKPSIQFISVFNMEQCIGIPKEKIPVPVNASIEPIKKCESILASMFNPPKIYQVKENTVYYDPAKDFIQLPPMSTFESPDLYYLILFNELVRSAFHPSRPLKPDIEIKQCNAEPFTLEALVAEMGASYLAQWAGLNVEAEKEDETYLNTWIKLFTEDKYLVVKAGTITQKAVDFIINGGGKSEVQKPEQKAPPLEEEKPKRKSEKKQTSK